MRYVWSVWSPIRRKILSAKSRLLILDFDGTLAKIAKTPSEVVLKKKTRQILARLSRSPFYRLAVVSGRSLESLTSFFDIENIIYVGNHGLELMGGKLSLPEKAKKARKLDAFVRLLGEKLREDFSRVPGVWIEDKTYTLSIHHRNIAREHYPFFTQEMDRFRKQFARWPLVWREGKKVWEVRPRVKWDKGEMALYLAKKTPGALPVIIGDDTTDEDMFKALRHRGITIHVGLSGKSSAEYSLKSPRDVRVFLEELCRL